MQHEGLDCCDGSGDVRPFLMSAPLLETLLTRCFIGGLAAAHSLEDSLNKDSELGLDEGLRLFKDRIWKLFAS